jgi:hypothetical protein
MTRPLLLLLLAVPTARVAGAEAVEHRGVWVHPEQFRNPQLANQWNDTKLLVRMTSDEPHMCKETTR